jgi:hypothetical protein
VNVIVTHPDAFARKQLEDSCRRLIKQVTDELPDDMCILLILADRGEGGFTSYMSTEKRAESIDILRDMINRLGS